MMGTNRTAPAALVGAVMCSLILASQGPASAGTVTKTYSSGSISAAIPDESSENDGFLVRSLKVGDDRKIKDLDVKVRLDHTADGQLAIYLLSPHGKLVQLSVFNGGVGDDYGTAPDSCSGSPTTFDDEAGTSITGGAAPFSGSFMPETPLSDLDGKRANGKWFLLVEDDQSAETGTLFCWKLRFKLKT